MYLERNDHFPKKQRAILSRVMLISKSVITMMGHFYSNYGFFRAFKELVGTILYFDIVLLMTRSDTKKLLMYHPTLLNGSLYRPYLATSFNSSRRTRYRIFISHYTYLAARLKATFYEQVADCKLTLWRATIDGEIFSICISFEKIHRSEGDLTLSFDVNSTNIYQISFTIVPGPLVGCSTPRVLLIARVQGAKEGMEKVRRATRLCKDIAPPHLLVVAAQAIAYELDVSLVAGVSSGEQLSKTQEGGFPFQFDYDAFWKNCCGTETTSKFYVFPASFMGKPLDEVGSEHRRRTRLKRQFKTTVKESIRTAFAEKCLAGQTLNSRGRGNPAV